MAKRNPYEGEMFKDFKIKIFDPNAFTVEDIRKKFNFGADQTRKRIKEKLESGEWEQVWRRDSLKPIMAYRLKKK